LIYQKTMTDSAPPVIMYAPSCEKEMEFTY
jgi:hypothetical protein